MNTSTPPILDLHKVQQYGFSKHHVVPGTQVKTVSNVAQSLFGLHSARLPSPYVTLHSRLVEFRTKDLRHSLLSSKEVIKLRCMRRTLHILPLELAPVAHKATLEFRIIDCVRTFEKIGLSDAIIEDLRLRLIEKLSSRPLPSQDIVYFIINKLDCRLQEFSATQRKLLAKTLLKYLWELGELCYINISEKWDSEHRLYASTKQFYPNLELDSLSVHEAKRQLIYQHIHRFGPVSIKDISWWSGLSMKQIKQYLVNLEKDQLIIRVTLNGPSTHFYMTSEDYDFFMDFVPVSAKWMCLLAYEDPSLKGYYESRFRYIDPSYYELLFNQIGEARPSILLNGRVVGVWEWDKKKRTIISMPFANLRKKEICLLNQSIQKLEDKLRDDYSQLMLV